MEILNQNQPDRLNVGIQPEAKRNVSLKLTVLFTIAAGAALACRLGDLINPTGGSNQRTQTARVVLTSAAETMLPLYKTPYATSTPTSARNTSVPQETSPDLDATMRSYFETQISVSTPTPSE